MSVKNAENPYVPISDSSSSSSSPSADTFSFTRTWENADYRWPKIVLNPTSIEQGPNQIVTKFSFMNNKENFINLAKNIKNNAILSVKDVNRQLVLDYFDYESMGLKNQNLSDEVKNVHLRNYLGFDGPKERKRDVSVVTLLTSDTRFIGICYDSCGNGSKIDRASILEGRNTQTNRVLCTKSGNKLGIKIAFFPKEAYEYVENPSDFIFYEGDVMFGNKGAFLGLNGTGKLLKKSRDGFNLFDATFIDGAISINIRDKSKMYQYNNEMKLTGYAFGNIPWDLKLSNANPPLESLSSGDNFCVNLDLGSVTVSEDTNDDKASKCSKMYYTVSSRNQEMFGGTQIDTLFNSARGGIDVGIKAVDRKIEFIEKEGYTENVPVGAVDNCTLYKFKCKVSDGVFCIIEVILCDDFIRRIRIYKFYTQVKPVDDSDKKGVIKKEGLFVALYEKTGNIKSVSIVQQRIDGLHGMEYNMDDDKKDVDMSRVTSRKLMPIDTSDAMVKEFEKKNNKKLSSRCRLFDDYTRGSFESSIGAAAACYSLFFGDVNGGGGCVGVLLKQLSSLDGSGSGSGSGSGVDFSAIAGITTSKVANAINHLNEKLTHVLELVDGDEQSKRVAVKSRFNIIPMETPVTPVNPVINPQVEVEKEGEEEEEEGEGEGEPEAAGEGEILVQPLPSGWVEHADPASGKFYYENAATGKTQREHPTEAAGDVIPLLSEKDQSSALKSPSSGSSESKPLPPGWTEQVENGVTYYVNESKGFPLTANLTIRPTLGQDKKNVKIVLPDGKVRWLIMEGGRRRGTNKNRHHRRRGNGNTQRRLTRKVKASRRVVHRGGGGRGGRGGRRRTIKKYHRR
jgi:hypothetical protein